MTNNREQSSGTSVFVIAFVSAEYQKLWLNCLRTPAPLLRLPPSVINTLANSDVLQEKENNEQDVHLFLTMCKYVKLTYFRMITDTETLIVTGMSVGIADFFWWAELIITNRNDGEIYISKTQFTISFWRYVLKTCYVIYDPLLKLFSKRVDEWLK